MLEKIKKKKSKDGFVCSDMVVGSLVSLWLMVNFIDDFQIYNLVF